MTRTWPGGPLLPSAPLLSTTSHSSPQGLTAGLARNYGPVIGQRAREGEVGGAGGGICLYMCVSGHKILVCTSREHTIRGEKKKLLTGIVLHTVIYEAAMAGETGGVFRPVETRSSHKMRRDVTFSVSLNASITFHSRTFLFLRTFFTLHPVTFSSRPRLSLSFTFPPLLSSSPLMLFVSPPVSVEHVQRQ